MFWLVVSYLTGTVVYLVGSWWWTVFIFLALVALAVGLIILYNKKKDGKLRLKREED